MTHGYANNNFYLIVSESSNYKVQVYKWDHTNNVFTNNMSSHQTIIPGTKIIPWDITLFKANFVFFVVSFFFCKPNKKKGKTIRKIAICMNKKATPKKYE